MFLKFLQKQRQAEEPKSHITPSMITQCLAFFYAFKGKTIQYKTGTKKVQTYTDFVLFIFRKSLKHIAVSLYIPPATCKRPLPLNQLVLVKDEVVFCMLRATRTDLLKMK